LVNSGPQAKLAWHLFLSIKFYLNCPCSLICISSMAAFTLQWEAGIAVTETVGFALSKVFTVW
jgi:hypothetical protein